MIQLTDKRAFLLAGGQYGMTLREWYIGQALAGLLARPNRGLCSHAEEEAIKRVDRLLELLEKEAK